MGFDKSSDYERNREEMNELMDKAPRGSSAVRPRSLREVEGVI